MFPDSRPLYYCFLFAAGPVMLMLLAIGILFLSNMAFTGRPTYEEILMKAKNGQLPAPEESGDSGVNLAGQYKLFIIS